MQVQLLEHPERMPANTGEVTLVKNEDYQVPIEDMGNEGEGIGHVQGMTVFVKDAVVGDLAEVKIVKVKKNIAYGKIDEAHHTIAIPRGGRCATRRNDAAEHHAAGFL